MVRIVQIYTLPTSMNMKNPLNQRDFFLWWLNCFFVKCWGYVYVFFRSINQVYQMSASPAVFTWLINNCSSKRESLVIRNSG